MQEQRVDFGGANDFRRFSMGRCRSARRVRVRPGLPVEEFVHQQDDQAPGFGIRAVSCTTV